MKLAFLALLCFLPSAAHAWGRHDLLTSLALGSPEFSQLKDVRITPEPIEAAAPDLMKRVVPALERWCLRYHAEHDTRYDWKIPEERPLPAKQELLWMLEDNIETPLGTGPEKNAAEILVGYALEPDGMMDSALNHSPYIERLRDSMNLFYQGNERTHAFRHYYVPLSLLPPILVPKGIAPYRAALYSRLSSGAFATGHPYWGFRFLAWAIHYAQDITQPWHTVFLPGLSFLKFSKSAMKHEISALHYLTEAFGDSWMERPHALAQTLGESLRALPHAISRHWGERFGDPWWEAEMVEELANAAHDAASDLGSDNRDIFSPVVDALDENLKPTGSIIRFGGLEFPAGMLDFDGNGVGATEFLAPIWSPTFELGNLRDHMLAIVARQLGAAVGASRVLLLKVLEGARPACVNRAG